MQAEQGVRSVDEMPADLARWSVDSAPLTPKPWPAMAGDVPDMFLSNLFGGTDDASGVLSDFSGSGTNSGSESGGSPEAFQDFMLGLGPDMGAGMEAVPSQTFSTSEDSATDSPSGSIAVRASSLEPNASGALGGMPDTFAADNRLLFGDMVNMPNVSVDALRPGGLFSTLSGPDNATLGTTQVQSPLQSVKREQAEPAGGVLSPQEATVRPEPDMTNPPAAAERANLEPLPGLQAAMQPQQPVQPQSLKGAEAPAGVQAPMPPALQPGSLSDARTAVMQLRERARFMSEQRRAAAASESAIHVKQEPASSSIIRTSGPVKVRGRSSSEDEPENGQSKKVAHNAIERKYRSNINDRIARLRDVVPALRDTRSTKNRKRKRRKDVEEELVDGVPAATKLSKATVLGKATEYIVYLKSRETRLARDVEGLRMLVRSLQGGDELLALWSAEMEQADREAAAVAESAPAESSSTAEENEPADADFGDEFGESDDEDASPPLCDHMPLAKAPRYLLSAFAGFSILGGATVWETGPGKQGSFVAVPSHARVLGASHQLMKRASGVSWLQAPHHFDHVPFHLLLLELSRTVALLALLAVFFMSILRFFRASARREQRTRQLRYALALCAHEPEEDVSPKTAVYTAYDALQQALDAPTNALCAVMRIPVQVALGGLVRGPRSIHRLVADWVHSGVAHEARTSLLGAHLARLRLEVTLGRSLQPSTARRLFSALSARTLVGVDGLTPMRAFLCALALYGVAQDSPVLGGALRHEAARLWRAARKLLPAHGPDGDAAPSALADALRLPLDRAYAFALHGPQPAEMPQGQPLPNPLSNIVDALRVDELFGFWTALAASLGRFTGQMGDLCAGIAQAKQQRGRSDGGENAFLLDVVSDRASLQALRRRLALAAQHHDMAMPLPAQEHLLVAQGTLSLVAGDMSAVRRAATLLQAPGGSHRCSTRSAALFIALVQGASPRAGEPRTPAGPVDMIASAVLAWLQLYRTLAENLTAESSEEERQHTLQQSLQSITELRTLASACLWLLARPSERVMQPSSSLGKPGQPAAAPPLPGMLRAMLGMTAPASTHVREKAIVQPRQMTPLVNALDVLVDTLNDLSERVDVEEQPVTAA